MQNCPPDVRGFVNQVIVPILVERWIRRSVERVWENAAANPLQVRAAA